MPVFTGTIYPDTITGTTDPDTIDGLQQNDILRGLAGGDVISGGEGADQIWGDEDNDDISGNQGADIIFGGHGNDIIGGGSGLDTMDGGEGNDAITGAAGDDFLIGGWGNDTLTGGDNNDTLTDDQGDDILNGGLGNDIVKSLSGADTIDGGEGDDLYFFSGPSETNFSTLADASGTDTYDFGLSIVGVSADLRAGFVSNVGSRTFDEIPGTVIERVLGTGGGDSFWGNDANNYFDGRGGGDSMFGGAGNDTYIFDSEFDQATELANEGTADTVRSTTTVNLLGDNIENLYLDGTANIHATGNSGVNSIFGNAGNNILNGGFGADVLSGGAGNDSYTFETAGDVAIEQLNAGIDIVFSSISVTLSGNIENLTFFAGSQALNATGNSLNNVIVGNEQNNYLDGRGGADTMTGGLGNDIYVVDNAGDVISETGADIRDEVISSVSYTLGANLENLYLIGSSPLFGTGNSLDNFVVGTAFSDSLSTLGGNDILDGGALGDAMQGGSGSDTYYVDNAGDAVVETLAGNGVDVVYASVNYALTANVERLFLTGTAITGQGGAFNEIITGNAQANHLLGWAGQDTLDGGAGADTMEGGTEGDTYVVDNAGDIVVELAGGGTDRVDSSITFSIFPFAEVENLFLTGTGNINATGNTLSNLIRGNSGNNSIDGQAGRDTMEGGAGSDRYYVDHVSDIVTELADGGADSVFSTVSYTLRDHVEQLELSESSGAINGTGGATGNTLVGNSAANILNGGGAADSMQGRDGDDTYYVDNTGDTVWEGNLGAGAHTGVDRVYSSVSFTIGNNVEFLYLTGTANIDGTGSSTVNTLIGNSGNNILNGMAGADTMSGGTGNDTFFVDNAGDLVSEGANAGTDTVHSSLAAASTPLNVENLVLLTGAVNGTGSTANNRITGNNAANVLLGLDGNDRLTGGGGIDTLTGGNHNDDFEFLNSFGGPDTITDFGNGNDFIMIFGAGFYGLLAPGAAVTLIASAAPAPTAAAPQFLYNTTNGQLFFDYDGTLTAASDHLATLTGAPALTAGDFIVY